MVTEAVAEMRSDDLIKIVVDLPAGAAASAEVLWGAAIDERRYELRSVPIWAYGLAFEDIVEAAVGPDGRNHLSALVRRSGLLTVRVAGPDAPREMFMRLRDVLAQHAVAAEHYSASYSAFAIAPVEFERVLPIVDGAEQSGQLFVEVANEEGGDSGIPL
jgi:Domain of unknown function (DUF4265)